MKDQLKLSFAAVLVGACLTTPVSISATELKASQMQVSQEVSDTLNINVATAGQLQALPGIGKQKAEAIIQYREQHGRFTSTDDLTRVKGIGKKVLQKLSGKVSV